MKPASDPTGLYKGSFEPAQPSRNATRRPLDSGRPAVHDPRMLRRLYDRVMELSGRPGAAWWLAAISFVEASVFPIPPDLLLIPMILAERRLAWRYAAIATVASVVGGWLGYAIGALLYATIGREIIHFYHLEAGFASFQADVAQWGMWLIIAKGATPIPFKLVTIGAGVVGMALVPFTIAAIIARAMRFFLVAALFYWFGPEIRGFVERWLVWVTTAFVVVLVGGFVAFKFL